MNKTLSDVAQQNIREMGWRKRYDKRDPGHDAVTVQSLIVFDKNSS